MPDDERDRMLSDALVRRYRSRNVNDVAKMLDEELGTGPYRTHVRTTPDLKPKLNAWGAFQANPGRVSLQQGLSPEGRMATLAHELGHVADEVLLTPGINQGSQQSRLHHGNFRNFEPEFADSLNEQSAIEMGLPANKDKLAKYPWLRAVNPRASNKLASPWSGAKPSLPPDIYNVTRNKDDIDVLIEEIKKLDE